MNPRRCVPDLQPHHITVFVVTDVLWLLIHMLARLRRWCTMRRTLTQHPSLRWQTEREVHRCYLGVFRNMRCMSCRCWRSRRWVTAPRATPYRSGPKKTVGSLSLTRIPDLPSRSFARRSRLSYLSSVFFFSPSTHLSTAQTFIYNISALVCTTRAHPSNATPIKLSAAGLVFAINKSHVHRHQNIKYKLSKIPLNETGTCQFLPKRNNPSYCLLVSHARTDPHMHRRICNDTYLVMWNVYFYLTGRRELHLLFVSF